MLPLLLLLQQLKYQKLNVCVNVSVSVWVLNVIRGVIYAVERTNKQRTDCNGNGKSKNKKQSSSNDAGSPGIELNNNAGKTKIQINNF